MVEFFDPWLAAALLGAAVTAFAVVATTSRPARPGWVERQAPPWVPFAAAAALVTVWPLFAPTTSAAARDEIPTIRAVVERIVDGDTVVITVTPWRDAIRMTESVRVRGINAPETHGPCPAAAKAAKDRLAALTPPGSAVTLRGVSFSDPHGRVLAALIAPDGRDVAATLIAEGLAQPYDGRGKAGRWCPSNQQEEE